VFNQPPKDRMLRPAQVEKRRVALPAPIDSAPSTPQPARAAGFEPGAPASGTASATNIQQPTTNNQHPIEEKS